MADIALVTPLRDGMNLVAKEYVAAKRDMPGVLILSELAGAALELKDALLVNPNNVKDISEAIAAAVAMPIPEQKTRLRRMQGLLARKTVDKWAADFLGALEAMDLRNSRLREARLFETYVHEIKGLYERAGTRLLLLDYDGTLVPLKSQPEDATPGEAVRSTLTRLSGDPRNTVVVCSGRDCETLDSWLGDLPVRLAAEHGAFYKEEGVWHGMAGDMPVWDHEVLAIMERVTDQTPGSRIEKKKTTLVWHYRNSDAWLAELREKLLIRALAPLCDRLDLHMMRGNKVLEIKASNVNKGTEALRLLADYEFDFVMAMGDDVTDEDMFRALPPEAVTIRVGDYSPIARYNLGLQAEVLPLLNALADRP